MDCKLYIISHSDLPIDYQIPQSNHAAMEFAAKYPAEFYDWHKRSNSIINLNCKNELDLIKFGQKLSSRGIKFAEFREPDIGNELTAIAICPGSEIRKLCSNLPLAGKRINPEARERLNKKSETVEAMQACEQTSGQTIWQHGESVRDYLMDLIKFLRDPHYTSQYTWRYPQWILSHSKAILELLPEDHILERYALWHDCGKPFCKTVDENGKAHFPNHAQVSANLFRELYPEQQETALLIEMDMDIHLLSADGIDEFAKKPQAAALLLSGLAAIHSNAEMFGDTTSESFKIKWKHIDRRGSAICKKLFQK